MVEPILPTPDERRSYRRGCGLASAVIGGHLGFLAYEMKYINKLSPSLAMKLRCPGTVCSTAMLFYIFGGYALTKIFRQPPNTVRQNGATAAVSTDRNTKLHI